MPLDPRRPISDIDRLAYEIGDLRAQIARLALPSGTQRAKVLDYLLSLAEYNDIGSNTDVVSPRDSVLRWSNPSPDNSVVVADFPHGQAVLSASASATIRPTSTGQVGAYVSWEVRDANNTIVPNGGVNIWRGELFGGAYMSALIRTPDLRLYINDRVANPGPYTVQLKLGVFATAANTSDPSTTFNGPNLSVRIVGNGPGV